VTTDEAVPGPSGPRRDGLTTTGYLVLGTWGWFLCGFGVLVPLLRLEQDTTRAVGALHSVALASGALLAGMTATQLIRRLRRRRVLQLSAGLVVAGVCLLLVGSPIAVTLTATLIAGTGGAMMVNVAMPTLLDHHGAAGTSIIAEGNAVGSAMSLFAPLVIGATLGLGLSWRPAFVVVVVLIGASLWRLRAVRIGTPAVDAVSVAPAAGVTPLPRRFWPAAMVVVICLGVEFCATTWSADLVRVRTDLGPGAATATISTLAGAMAVGRLVSGRLTLRHPTRTVLAGAMCLAGVGWAVLWTATTPFQAMLGLMITGLGLAGNYPLGMALALSRAPGQGDQATGRISAVGALAVGSAPFTLGALADASDLHTAFLVFPVLLVLALLTLLLGCRSTPAGI
jgi:predicted MFS family arabinose efflux permease